MIFSNKLWTGQVDQCFGTVCPLCGSEPTSCHYTAMDTAQLSRLVNAYLAKLCICPSLSGYDYIHFSILYCLDHPKAVRQVTTTLYPKIGEAFHTTAQGAERSIRYALRQAWKMQSEEWCNLMAAHAASDKCPGNGKFLAAAVQRLQVMYLL